MAKFSSKRQQASSKIRNLLLMSTSSSSKGPPSPSHASRRASSSSLMLLEQLRGIEMQWVNVIHELANMIQLEPLLFKRMLRNVAQELKTMEEFSVEVHYQGMDLEILVKKVKLCKDKLKQTRALKHSLNQALNRLSHLKDLPEDEPTYDHPRSILSPLPFATENAPKLEKSSPSHTPTVSSAHTSPSAGNGSPAHNSSLPRDERTQGSIIPKQRTEVGMIRYDSLVNYPQLLKSCKALLDLTEKFIGNIEVYCNQFDEWRRTMDVFWSESNGLRTWMRATCMALAQKDRKISPALAEAITTRRQALLDLHEHTTHVLALPSTAKERECIKDVISKLDAKWETLAHSLPISMRLNATITVDPISHLRPPAVFENVVEMVEWLILVESKLQPHPLVVGDTTKLRTLLDEISATEKELTLKSSDYHRFMRAGMKGETFDYNDPGSPQKAVKFYDEDTIDRHQRRKEIDEDRLIDSLLHTDVADENKQRTGTLSKSSPRAKGRPPDLTIKNRPCSVSALPSVFSPSSEESQQLSLLWNGVWSMLSQRKQELESVLDIWSGFDSKRRNFEHFVGLVEIRMPKLFSKLKTPTSVAQLNTTIEELKTFGDDVAQHQQKLGSLNDLTTDLIHRHRNTDNTEELQKSMTRLNVRWKKAHESFLKKKATIEFLSRRWDSFFQAYQQLHNWMEDRDACLTGIDSSANDLVLIHKAVETIKVIQRELASHSDSLTNIKFYLSKLQGDSSAGGSVVNIGFLNRNVEFLERQRQQFGIIAQERLNALEKSHFERKEVFSIVTRCEVWTKRAEEHMASVRPAIAEAAKIITQLDTHKEFEIELKERQTQIALALARAKHMTSDFMNPLAISTNKTSEELKSHFTALLDRLEELSKESKSWRRELDSVKTIMDEFQVLSDQLSQKLSDWQEKLSPEEPLGSSMQMLRHQLEHWQQCETGIGSLGKMLESMVTSQRKLVDMGAQISIDVVQLVKRYHKQWSEVKKVIVLHVAEIKNAMERLDPESLSSALPRGWNKAMTPTGSPYYVNTSGGNQTQWQHPELAAIYHRSSIKFQHPYYPSPTYLISLRLRALQREIQLDWLPTEIAMRTFEEYKLHLNPNKSLSHTTMMEIALSMFHRAAINSQGTNDMLDKPVAGGLNVHRAVDLSVAWVHHVYDLTHAGTVTALSFQTAFVCLSSSKMEEKHKALFQVISRGRGTVSMDELISFMETFIQIPQSMTDSQYCALNALETHVKECFQKYATGSHLHPIGYLAWTQGEPLPIAWLPILHRMTAAETMEHNATCAFCKISPIVGFHYKCLQCSNLSLCQECYWSGRTAKDHDRATHFMEEYCVSKDERSLRFRSLGNRSGRKRSPRRQHPSDPPTAAPSTEESSLPQESHNGNHVTGLRRQTVKDPLFKSAVTRLSGSGSPPSDPDTSHGGKGMSPRPASSGSAVVTDSSQWQPHSHHTSVPATSTAPNRVHNVPRIPIKDPHMPATDQSNPSGAEALPTMPPRKPVRNKVLLSPTGVGSFLLPTVPRPTSDGRLSESHHGVTQTQERSPVQLMHSNVKLRERVEKLESHNKQLEDYISQLKSYAQMDDHGSPNSDDQLF